MSRHEPDIDTVTRLVIGVARDVALPRYPALGAGDVESKPSAGHRDDIVTVADREAEDRLSAGLAEILAAPVIGEEATHADPGLLRLLDRDGPVWIVDPIDGTKNFAAGRDGFGIMVGLAVGGEMRAAWIHLAARGETFVAARGAGATLNGERVRVPERAPDGQLRGALFARFMPPAVRELVATRTRGRFHVVPQSGAAAIEYTDILAGRRDFAVFHRLLPWDHGAPALLLTEAGGAVVHADGRPYGVRSADEPTIAARHADVAATVCSWLAG